MKKKKFKKKEGNCNCLQTFDTWSALTSALVSEQINAKLFRPFNPLIFERTASDPSVVEDAIIFDHSGGIAKAEV